MHCSSSYSQAALDPRPRTQISLHHSMAIVLHFPVSSNHRTTRDFQIVLFWGVEGRAGDQSLGMHFTTEGPGLYVLFQFQYKISCL